MKVSDDYGATWSAQVRLAGSGASGSNGTFRNPVAAVDRTSGQIVLHFVNTTTEPTWVNLQRVSNDDGATWGDAVPVALSNASVQGVLPGPGHGIQLRWGPAAGRLLFCGATGYHAGHAMETAVYYSDAPPAAARYNVSATFSQFQECAMAELPAGVNGSTPVVLLNMRNSHLNPCDCRAVAASRDGGETWSPAPWFVPALVEPVCSAGMVSVGPLLVFSNPANTHARINMTVWVSADGGATWPADTTTVVWPGPAAYSALSPVTSPGAANVAGVLFERGSTSPYERLSFARLRV